MQQSSPRPSIRAPYLCTVEAEFRERNVPGLNLHLTTRFADDVLALGPIRIRIAVSRAYLNFRLQNCGLPLSCSLEQTWPRREKTKSTIKKRSAKQEVGGDQIALGKRMERASEGRIRLMHGPEAQRNGSRLKVTESKGQHTVAGFSAARIHAFSHQQCGRMRHDWRSVLEMVRYTNIMEQIDRQKNTDEELHSNY